MGTYHFKIRNTGSVPLLFFLLFLVMTLCNVLFPFYCFVNVLEKVPIDLCSPPARSEQTVPDMLKFMLVRLESSVAVLVTFQFAQSGSLDWVFGIGTDSVPLVTVMPVRVLVNPRALLSVNVPVNESLLRASTIVRFPLPVSATVVVFV